MRIAFDHQIFGWQEYGGVSRYLYELAQQLATTYQQDVNIVAPLFVNHYLKQNIDELKVWGIPISHIPRTGRVVQTINSLLVKPLLKYLAADIVHETYYSATRYSPKSAKVILTVHDMIHERYPDLFNKPDVTCRNKAAAVERADHVICVSRQTQRDLIDLIGVNPEKTSVVYHGFKLTASHSLDCEVTDGRPFLLYVGHRAGHKNFARLLRAIAISPKLRKNYRIVCFGGGMLNKSEKIMISKLGFNDGDVHQVSGSDAVLAGLYQNAKAFIYPSLYEGFGIPPLEAMSFNCPVACSRVSSIPEVVGDAGVYFDPTNIEDISKTIEKLTTDDLLRNNLIACGQVRLKEFSWQRCAAETLDIYQKVLSTSN